MSFFKLRWRWCYLGLLTGCKHFLKNIPFDGWLICLILKFQPQRFFKDFRKFWPWPHLLNQLLQFLTRLLHIHRRNFLKKYWKTRRLSIILELPTATSCLPISWSSSIISTVSSDFGAKFITDWIDLFEKDFEEWSEFSNLVSTFWISSSCREIIKNQNLALRIVVF